MRLAALTLALAPLATTRAEVVHVLEDFSDAQRFFTELRSRARSPWARNGTKSMYESTRQGLRSLASDDQVLLEALDVFGGAMTCCRLLCGNQPVRRVHPTILH